MKRRGSNRNLPTDFNVPVHQWKGTSLRFEGSSGWGEYIDLKGEDGVSISDVEQKSDRLVVKYSNGSKTELKFPDIIKGDVGIESIQQIEESYFYIILTDGSRKKIKLPKGKDGVGIESINQINANVVEITLTDGSRKKIKLPKGKDGVGIESIDQSSKDSFKITLTNGLKKTIILPKGEDGREIELAVQNRWVVWRYKDDEDWKKLFLVPVVSIGANTSNLVPYTGAKRDVYLGDKSLTASNISTNYVDFDLTFAEDATAEGRLSWNNDDGTLQIGMPGGNVVLQVGQEQLIRARNTTGITVTNGQAVYITGATGNNPTIGLAQADDKNTAVNVIGVATEDISNNQLGYINVGGLVRGLDTSAFSEGASVYLSASSAGDYTVTPPSLPNYTIRLGYVLRSHSTEGIILVSILSDSMGDLIISGNTISNGVDGININDPGIEEDGISVNGDVYDVALRINDIGGNHPGEFVIHRHSTTLPSVALGTRSNSNDENHADVVANMVLWRLIGCGWAGDDYKMFGDIRFKVDNTGTISNTSSPGRLEFRVTQDGDITPTQALRLESDLSATFAGDVSVTGFFNIGMAVNKTIASGAITVTSSNVVVDTESAAASDDLDTITGGSEGDVLVLRPLSSARTVVVKHATGNIYTGTDITLNNLLDNITLIKQGSVWLRYATANNGL